MRPDPPRTLADAVVQIEELWTLVGTLVEHAEKLQARNEELSAQVEELLERGSKSSKNSSKPPSTDSDAQRAKRKKKRPSGRRQGAQDGHPKHERALVPEADVDEIRRYFPSGQCACGGAVCADAQPTRHQVFDLPPTRFDVTEHQLFGGCCAGCGRRHAATVPSTVPSGQMSPGLVAWIALMGGEYHLSVSKIQRLLADRYSLPFSLGAISNAQGLATDALAVPYEAIGDHVRASSVAHADETRHPRGAGKEPATWWMWTMTTAFASFFSVHFSRGKQAAAELLGEFLGVLVTDDLGSYNGVPMARRQLCWSHLIRHFTAIGERGARAGAIGQRLLLIGQAVIRTRHRLPRNSAGTGEQQRIEEPRYRRRMERLRRSLHETLERGARLRTECRTRRQCRHLLTREPMLWTFLADRSIGLTNNAAERALRPYVIWRKLAFASHSRRGDHFRARMLSVGTTARQQGVPLYAFLRRVCHEALEPGGVRSTLPIARPLQLASPAA